jgi:hypothetical protein
VNLKFAANARAEAADGKAFGSPGTMPPSRSSNACTTCLAREGMADDLLTFLLGYDHGIAAGTK